MKAAPFEYHAPGSVDEAVALLAAHLDDAKALAGGQSLVPMLALRLARFGHLVDLNAVTGLSGIEQAGGEIVIGATTRQATAERSGLVRDAVPLLSRALPLIGHFQIRNRGTVGGSIAHADPASELPCVALCLGATIGLAGPRGHRRVAAEDFFVSVWQTQAEPDEIVTELRFPVAPARSGFAIEELAYRTGDFAVAGVATAVELDGDGRVDRVRLAYMGMGPTPRRAPLAEAALVGLLATEVDAAAVGAAAVDELEPSDDVHATAAYRARVTSALTESALAASLEEATHG